MIRHLIAALRTEGLEYCEKCGWWTKPRCGH